MDTIARLKELMQKRGISLYELAKRGSLNYSTLKYDVRYNHPLSVETIGQICKTLGIPLYQFFMTEQDREGFRAEIREKAWAKQDQRGHRQPCTPS